MKLRKLLTHKEYLEAEALQKRVWGFADREIIPLNELVVAQKNGGLVFGTFERSRMIGFCFGVPAIREGRVFHYSRMLGVLPEFQGKNIGFKMKLFQRSFVISQKLDLIRWTFDPLQTKNAYFNLEKLGATVSDYIVNFYGDSSSTFNRGLETDRFVSTWEIISSRVKERLTSGPPNHVLTHYSPCLLTTLSADGYPQPGRSLPLRGRKIGIEVPTDIDSLKAKSLPLAQKWRWRTRTIFMDLFKRGFRIIGFVFSGKTGYYLAERNS